MKAKPKAGRENSLGAIEVKNPAQVYEENEKPYSGCGGDDSKLHMNNDEKSTYSTPLRQE